VRRESNPRVESGFVRTSSGLSSGDPMKLKKMLLALIVTLISFSFAAPVFACGGDKTAEKEKDAPKVAQDDGDDESDDDEEDKKDEEDDGKKG
jgi:hypothetical protein